MKLTLLFNSSEAAEIAWSEYFDGTDAVINAYLRLKDAAIDIEAYSELHGETHLQIPEGLIAIVI
ncbi:MAG: hypothetical protein F6K28_52615 [Microcoleus sp. SIO2G3]|nr:hypothetical protein [Microcoleus sp. SIO2G3]